MEIRCSTPEAYKLLHQGTLALSEIEKNGIKIDTVLLNKTIEEIGNTIKRMKEKLETSKVYQIWKKEFGDKANLGSGPQLAHILYNKLGIECKSLTDKGSPSTSEKSLQDVDHPFVRRLFKIKHLEKTAGTFLKGIRREVCNGYLHPSFNLHLVKSLRSCIARGTLIEIVRDISKYPNGIPIECIKVGDYVYCYDNNLDLCTRKVLWSGKTGTKNVIRLHWVVRGKLGCLDLTPEHKVRLSDGEYIRAKDLDIVDPRGNSFDKKRFPKISVLAIGKGRNNQFGSFIPKNHRITKVEYIDKVVDVYDLEVEEYHNFIANEICVHNSSSNPNFQNFPKRDEEMSKWVRSVFIPRKGRYFWETDFRGAEVITAAAITKDPSLYKYITEKDKDGKPKNDMHRDTAADLFLLKPSQVSSKLRFLTKNSFTFAEFYGSYYKQTAKDLWEGVCRQKDLFIEGTDISIKEHLAKKGIKKGGDFDKSTNDAEKGTFEYHVKKVEKVFWHERFKGYTQWKKEWYEKYLREGGFMMATGFYISGMMTKNAVLNYPIQGASFHCLLWFLIKIQRWIKKNKMSTLLVGQIHDSAEGDSPPEEIQDVLGKANELIQCDLPKAFPWFTVPMEIEVEVAPIDCSWYDKKPWIEKNGIWGPK